VVLAATLLTLAISVATVRGHPRETEFYVLLLLGALGVVAMTGANDLMLVAAAYLLASAPLYALTGFAKDPAGTEAALKYYLLGAFLGLAMLAGITVLFGLAGTTAYPGLSDALGDAPRGALSFAVVAFLAGLLFKAGAVPGHYWVPDVTQGAPVPVAAFVTTVPKIGALVAAYRLGTEPLAGAAIHWSLLLAVIATATMTLGNLAAFFQDDVRRLLAYSTISQVGYLLIPVAVATRADGAQRALLFYLAAYAVTNLGAFAVVAELATARRIDDYAGLFRRDPGLALALVVCLLGLVGTPPTAVFLGKLAVFESAIDGGYGWLAAVAVVNTVASVFYYLRWIAPTFLRAAPALGDTEVQAAAGRWARIAAHTAAIASLVLGLGAGAVAMVATRLGGR
jgi:NADH-quinone oxidoreductase subunit N